VVFRTRRGAGGPVAAGQRRIRSSPTRGVETLEREAVSCSDRRGSKVTLRMSNRRKEREKRGAKELDDALFPLQRTR
jgi:hypothetical protein